MARIFLDAGESRNGALAANDTVFGNTGTETVGINTGATNVRVEGTVEVVALPGAPSAFTYRAEGNNLVVFSDGVQIARIIVQDDANGTVINFNGGSVTANVGAGGLTLGGATVPTTAGPVNPPAFDPNAELTSALNTLSDAQEAREEFLASEEADLDDNDDTVTTEAEIEANLEDAQAELAAAPSAAQLNADVVEAEADLSDVQDRIDAVAGLQDAITDFRDAEEAALAAEEDLEAAGVEVQVAADRYEARNGGAVVDYEFDDEGNIEAVTADGEVIIELDGSNYVLAEGVNEEDNIGVTQLLAAVRTYAPVFTTYVDALQELDAASTNLDLLDADPAGDAAREDLADFLTAQEAFDEALAAYEAGNADSETDLTNAYEGLIAAGADRVVTDPATTTADYAAAIDADSEEVIEENTETEAEFQTAVEDAEVENPIYDDFVAAEENLADAEQAVEDRADLVTAVEDAQDLADQLDALNDDVDAATTAITDLGFESPTTLDDGTVQATARNDIFLATSLGEGDEATIGRFGRTGDDRLFIGSDFSLVEVESDEDVLDDNVGSATRLEAFIQQDGGNTVIFVENTAFAGSEEDASFDGYTITLTGVQASNVTFDNGYFSIA
jgi:hypothetical protein